MKANIKNIHVCQRVLTYMRKRKARTYLPEFEWHKRMWIKDMRVASKISQHSCTKRTIKLRRAVSIPQDWDQMGPQSPPPSPRYGADVWLPSIFLLLFLFKIFGNNAVFPHTQNNVILPSIHRMLGCARELIHYVRCWLACIELVNPTDGNRLSGLRARGLCLWFIKRDGIPRGIEKSNKSFKLIRN